MSWIRQIIAVLILFVGLVEAGQAKQYTKHVRGREVVVHTNPIPVVLHRMVPPQHGRHVTQRELQSGRIPQPGRYGSRVLP